VTNLDVNRIYAGISRNMDCSDDGYPEVTVNIRFTSSLTDQDENAIAPALLGALVRILDLLPITYVIRIDTSDANVYEHSGFNSVVPTAQPTHTGSPFSAA
jgi:hypothetical protein